MILDGTRYIAYKSWNDVFTIRVFSDGHDGAVGARNDKLERDIEEVKNDPKMFWYHLGDYADMINPSDARRFDPMHIDESIPISALGDYGTYMADRTIARFDCIKHKCLGFGFGNHEWYYMRKNDQMRMHDRVCAQLNVHNLGYCFRFNLRFIYLPGAAYAQPRDVVCFDRPQADANHGHTSDWLIRFFGHHGAGGSQTPGGKIKKVADAMQRFDADVYTIAHGHTQVVHPPMVTLGTNRSCTKLVPKIKLGAMAGSYLEAYPEGAYPGYAERAMYQPASLGALDIRIEPGPKRRRIEIPTIAEFGSSEDDE